jgi:hypothetical protein
VDRASLECFTGASLFLGLLIGVFVVQAARLIYRARRIPVPPEEQPSTPVIGADE